MDLRNILLPENVFYLYSVSTIFMLNLRHILIILGFLQPQIRNIGVALRNVTFVSYLYPFCNIFVSKLFDICMLFD